MSLRWTILVCGDSGYIVCDQGFILSATCPRMQPRHTAFLSGAARRDDGTAHAGSCVSGVRDDIAHACKLGAWNTITRIMGGC